MALVSLRLAEEVDSIFSLDWDTYFKPDIWQCRKFWINNRPKNRYTTYSLKCHKINCSLEPDKPKQLEISAPDAEVSRKALLKLQHLLEVKYSSIVSKFATDISRTNLIELDIPTEGPSIACKLTPYL